MSSISPAAAESGASVGCQDSCADPFSYLLLFVSLAALVPRLVLGTSQFIHYDGYWHLFTATQDRWDLFISEWQVDAHPPLYYLILRVVAKLGHSHLVYRSLSIIPGVGSVYVIGRIAKKLCRNDVVALLTAAAYGFSITMIDITCDVRGYPLALFLVLLALYYFLGFLLDDSPKTVSRPLALFGIFTSLAISAEYYSVLFWMACVMALVLNALLYPEFRHTKVKWLIREWYSAVPVIIGLPFCVSVYLYDVHLKHYVSPQGHVMQFYWSKNSSIIDFVLQNLRTDLNYIFPIGIPSTITLFVLLAPVVLVLSYSILFQESGITKIASTTAVLITLLLFLELIVLSIARRYPFGGEARQQSIIFPFVILGGFLALDRLVSDLRSSLMRNAVLLVTVVLIIFSFSYWWHKFPKISEELFTREYNAFETGLPASQAVYVDQFSLIAYYIHTYAWKWRFQNRFLEPKRVDSYRITSRSGKSLILLRSKQWNFDLLNPGFYTVLANSLRNAQVNSVNLFYIKQFPPDPGLLPIASAVNAVHALADKAGLVADPIVYKNREAYITFRLSSR